MPTEGGSLVVPARQATRGATAIMANVDGMSGGEATRVFAAGALHFVVVTSHDEDRRVIESLFGDLPSASPAPGDEISAFAFIREARDDGPRWNVGGPRVSSGSPVNKLGGALTLLMSGLNLAALDAQPETLHLHAAAAVRDNRAVVIAAQRNTGKTTTVAHLIGRGWHFLTDETVSLAPDDDRVAGFAKPLSIKPGGHVHIEHLSSALIPALEEAEASFRFVSATAHGGQVGSPALPHVVVLLSRDDAGSEESAVKYRKIHPADAVVKLMQETLDAGRFGSAAARLAALAGRSHCYEVAAGSPQATVDLIEELFALPECEPAGIDLLPTSAAFGATVATVRVDGRAVVHDQDSGRIFALDPMGTRVWEKLAGWHDHPDIDLEGPVVAPLVAQFGSLGVLAATDV